MTKEEYKERMISIERECARKKRDLNIEYAMSNNPYKVGDVVEDHIGKLRIERTEVDSISWDLPSCIYYGVELKKDGTPCKRQTNRPVFQLNLLKFNEV